MLRFKVTIGITALLVGLFVAAVLSIDVREVLGKTEHLASWAVAAGTIVLAFATF